jgi:hypothetical protein
MDRGANKQNIRYMMEYLEDRMRSPDVSGEVIIRRNEIEEFGRSVGMDEAGAWKMFGELQGHAWRGQFMPESRSEERGHTAARLTWARPAF